MTKFRRRRKKPLTFPLEKQGKVALTIRLLKISGKQPERHHTKAIIKTGGY